MADKKHNILEFEDLIREFVSTLDNIYRREIVRFNWRDIIFNRTAIGANTESEVKSDRKGLLYRYHKQFIALDRTIQLYGVLSQSLDRFKQEKDKVADEIKLLDLELSNRIRYFSVPSSWEVGWLKPIVEMLDRNPNVGISFIRQHTQEIVQKLKNFNDRKTAEELRAIIILLSGEEIIELNKCISDLSRWTSYRLTNKIEFFTERSNLYVRGGQDKLNSELYLGLASTFKDVDLAREIFRVPEIKKLWTYLQEMQFFSWARDVIMKSLREEGKWEGFYDFYNNLRKGKNYIKMVREKFGNIEFANFLERLHEKIHEAPEIWERDLAELNHKLYDITYQNKYVIEPARQALLRIFNIRIDQLSEESSNAINKLRALLNARVRELENAKAIALKQFGKIISKHRKKLVRHWENEKREYESREDSALFPLVSFNERSQKVLDRIDRRKKYMRYKMVLNYSIKGNLFLSNLFKVMITNQNKELPLERLEGPILYGLYKRYQLADSEAKLLDELESIEDSDIEELRRLITLARKIIFPNLDKLVAYIYGKVNQYFLPETIPALKANLNIELLSKAA